MVPRDSGMLGLPPAGVKLSSYSDARHAWTTRGLQVCTQNYLPWFVAKTRGIPGRRRRLARKIDGCALSGSLDEYPLQF